MNAIGAAKASRKDEKMTEGAIDGESVSAEDLIQRKRQEEGPPDMPGGRDIAQFPERPGTDIPDDPFSSPTLELARRMRRFGI